MTRGLSIVIPCYNTGDYVREAVASALSQPVTLDLEVIVVDDCSDDPATVAALADCRAAERVTVVQLPEHSGVQRARNAGVHAARMPYVLPLDSDDRLSTAPELLSEGTYPDRAVAILESDPAVAFVHTLTQMFGDCAGLTISAYPCRDELVARKHHVPTTIVYRRAEGIAAGLYHPDIRKWQDWAFAVALLAARFRSGAANRIGFLDGPFVEYRIHTRPNRISVSDISELAMTQLVVAANLDYFQHHHGDHCADDIARLVCRTKPPRLADLLHMAHHNLDQALALARQRDAELTSPLHELGIP
ncbi:glycosyltransferase family 2 protein [Nocardia uniformis]|uniref:Glycosyltransferase family 2 protein n=1 Tax=Nocardia uniformis TaxID=53432 RepID=A0A849C3K1_9NOCA|nr:glycosyltransferase family 2 protein [Nocardia uniformis]NNH71020.1 glycosyltransferase family 2 protein [Nocardia uniformis]